MKLEEVRKNYDRAAKRYDVWTDIVFGRILGVERYRERTIDLLGDLREKVVLDIGCGTGRNLPLLLRRMGKSGRIIGIDYSEGMLERANAMLAREGWKNVELRRDDAAKLESIDERIDAVVSVWCLGIVHDLDAALHRAVDVLQPGGRFAIMDFDRARPDQGILRWLYPVYSAVLQWAGIDSAEDLDDARLRSKWGRGRAVLEERLENLQEQRYLNGGGIILSGTAPRARAPESLALEITTPRLLLRPSRKEDFASSRAIWTDPEVRRFTGGPPSDEAFRTTFFDDLGKSKGAYGFKSVIEIATGLHVGDAGLAQKTVEGRSEVEVLYFFAKRFWGRGFATEAAKALIDYGFATLGLTRIMALIHPDNHASRRVAERIGMAFEREVTTDSGKLRRMFVIER